VPTLTRTDAHVRFILSRSLLSAAAVVAVVATSVAVGPVAATAAPLLNGASSETAAASCWEIKQNIPTSTDGSYWLLTPQLKTPQQFFCDMTTNGGGWVKIASGREGFQGYYDGTGEPSALLSTTKQPSAATVQLPSTTVDGLLAGTRVDSLADGIRVYRAKNRTGTQWQNVQYQFTSRDKWVWNTAAQQQRLSWYSFDGTRYSTTSNLNDFGRDSSYLRVNTDFSKDQSYTSGFAYGANLGQGSPAASSFLWSKTENGGAPRPYSEVYIRPKVVSTDLGFAAIADSGTAAQEQAAVASTFALKGAWGVTGHMNGKTKEGNAEVQDFVQIGDVVYVAGNFQYVQRGKNATGTDKVAQSSLAAFDANTGAFLPSFTPKFNEQVKTLEALPNGQLLAAGDFTLVNDTRAVGIVSLNPATGGISPKWRVSIENRLSSGVVSVRAIALQGEWLYLGGSFTHLSGGTSSNFAYSRSAARVKWSDGTPDAQWNPELNGTAVSIDPSDDGSRFYAAGYFTKSKGITANRVAAVETVAGAPLVSTPWAPQWSASAPADYQQTIRETGDKVFVGGSQHSMFIFDTTTFQKVRGYIGHPFGDFQASEKSATAVYAGCHCDLGIYENATNWPVGEKTNYTKVDKIGWIAAFDSKTGEIIPAFNPRMATDGGGVWGVYVANNGTVWAGGDITGSNTADGVSQWSGGFARFAAVDSVAPSAPTSVSVSTPADGKVQLSWVPSTDASGSVSYEILRDDRVVATSTVQTATVGLAGSNRFFVRAVDAAGNRSASTAVAVPGTQPAPDPSDPNLIPAGAEWTWRYSTTAPDASWTKKDFDDTDWKSGLAPLGFGHASVLTNVDVPAPTSNRAAAANFRRDFEVGDLSKLESLTLTTRADDGVVVYVNGVEVGRKNVSPGTVSNSTYANKAVSTANSLADPFTIEVPRSVLVEGVNTVAASVHLNYKSTPNVSFDLSGLATFGDDSAPEVPVEPEEPAEPETPAVSDIVTPGAEWSWRYDAAAPASDWSAANFDSSSWQVGKSAFGWGSASIATNIDAVSPRPVVGYFRKQFDLSNAKAITSLDLSTIADDGIVVYVNGVEVARKNVNPGPVTHSTYANRAVSTTNAATDPLLVQVPTSLLRDGSNSIAVSVHLNYRSTPNVSFDMKATVTR
jgi:hypothetical protein